MTKKDKDRLVELVDWLLAHNKNYIKDQYYVLAEIKQILEKDKKNG